MDEMTQATLVFTIKLGLALLVVVVAGGLLLTNWLEKIADQKQVNELNGLLAEIKIGGTYSTAQERNTLTIIPNRGIAYVKVTRTGGNVRSVGYCAQNCLCAFKLKGTPPKIKMRLDTTGDDSVLDLLNSEKTTIIACQDLRKTNPNIERVEFIANGATFKEAWGFPATKVDGEMKLMVNSKSVNVVDYTVNVQGGTLKVTLRENRFIEK